MTWEVRKSFKREGTYIYLWLIHVDVWQKPIQHCKAIILQFKMTKFLKNIPSKDIHIWKPGACKYYPSVVNLEMGSLSRLSKCNQSYQGGREKIHTHTYILTKWGQGEASMKMEQRDLQVLALKSGVMWSQGKECQRLSEAGRGRKGFSRASRESAALLTPWVQPRDKVFDSGPPEFWENKFQLF